MFLLVTHVPCYQGEDPSSRTLDLAPGPPQEKKLDGERRGMNLNDYNGDLRKGGRSGAGGGGLVFRSPNPKDVGPVETGPYGDKVVCKQLLFFFFFGFCVAVAICCPLGQSLLSFLLGGLTGGSFCAAFHCFSSGTVCVQRGPSFLCPWY